MVDLLQTSLKGGEGAKGGSETKKKGLKKTNKKKMNIYSRHQEVLYVEYGSVGRCVAGGGGGAA